LRYFSFTILSDSILLLEQLLPTQLRFLCPKIFTISCHWTLHRRSLNPWYCHLLDS
jgi:hypothetical protein